MTKQPRITLDPDRGGVILHLPQITHLDTQVWSADIGLTNEALRELRDAATTHLDSKAQDTEPQAHSAETTVRDHAVALHLIGEQLAGIEFWFWEHLASVRESTVAQQPSATTSRLPELLRAEADQFQAECPDHGTAEKRLPKCYCDLAEQQLRRADAIAQPDAKA